MVTAASGSRIEEWHTLDRLPSPPLLPCALPNMFGTYVLASTPVRGRSEAAEIRIATARERTSAGIAGRAHAIVIERQPAAPVAFVFQQRRGKQQSRSLRIRIAVSRAARRIRQHHNVEQPGTFAAFALLAHLCPLAVAILERSAPDHLTDESRSIFYRKGPRSFDGRAIIDQMLNEVDHG